MTTSGHLAALLFKLYHTFSFPNSASSSINSSASNTSSNSLTDAMHISCSWRMDQTSRSYVSSWACRASMLCRKASHNVHKALTALAARTCLMTLLLPSSMTHVSNNDIWVVEAKKEKFNRLHDLIVPYITKNLQPYVTSYLIMW